jgi:hypothetical protein
MAYARPDPAALKLRYAAFGAVDDDRVQYWLDDAVRGVDESWIEADFAPALIALAAHNMALAGLAADATAIPQGVSAITTGAFSATLAEAAVRQQIDGGLAATRYGQDYAALLRRNCGGPLVTRAGSVTSAVCGR